MKRNHLEGLSGGTNRERLRLVSRRGDTKLGREEDLLRGLSRRQEPYYRLRVERAWFGGGHPLPALFCPTIRVPLRVPQADSKRANTKT